jgi:type I restriction enzyme, S subunit
MLVAMPEFSAEQTSIKEKLSGLLKMIDQTENQFCKLRSLKTALMQDLLTGKVRVAPLLKKMEVGS